MKAKEVAYGGLMIAALLSIDFVFRVSFRDIQSYLEIPKTIIVAIFIHKMHGKHWLSYAVACFLASLLFFSLPDTLIYNVPSIICGCTLGLQNEDRSAIQRFTALMIVNFGMILFEMLMYGFFMQINLFAVYYSQIMLLLGEIYEGVISEGRILTGILLYYSFKAVISAVMLFVPYRVIFRYVKRIGSGNWT